MVLAEDARFSDVTLSSGLDFTHENGMRGELWLAEILGPGVGVLDFDNDGLLDVWAIQGGPLDQREGELPSDQLFRNESKDGKILFRLITTDSDVKATEYGMGIATADVDDDGDTDVFLANFGINQLWLNQGDGTFALAKQSSIPRVEEWSVAASFFDANDDGLLDVYVVNYVDFSLSTHKTCLGISHKPDYCAPTAYEPLADRFFVNQGNLFFVDATHQSGLSQDVGGGLGVIATDYNSDGKLDLYVANDPTENFLWHNLGDGRFQNVALTAGVAVNGDGKSEASMGIDAKDFDNDCDIDLFMTNLTSETNTLFKNSAKGWFLDGTNTARLGATSYPYTGFGTNWFDYDLDGDLDVFVANGAVSLIANEERGNADSPLAQRNQLWENTSDGKFVELRGAELMEIAETSRGVAFADLDNDGDTDLLVANNNGRLRVYQNNAIKENHWIGLDVREQGVFAYNAIVSMADTACTHHVVRTDGSYASANDPRIVFGFGESKENRHVEVTWRDGESQFFGPLAVDQYHVLERN